LCDPQRHFATIVPERARSCPPLLNAIFTASARHIYRLDRYKTSRGICYQGRLLSSLTAESAIHYQNECIPHLVHLSNNVEQVRDENLLAAAVILRFYEEVDGKPSFMI
jgi:Fungal specific transcription factor domain